MPHLSKIRFDDLPSAILVLSDDGHILGSNLAMRDMLARSQDGLLGRHWTAMMLPASVAKVEAFFDKPIRQMRFVEEIHLEFKHSAGHGVPMLCSAMMHSKEDQDVIVVSAMRMSMPRAATASRPEADGPVALPIVREPLLAAVARNPGDALAPLFGIGPGHLAKDAAALLRAVHPDDRERFAQAIAESAETLSAWKLQFRLQSTDADYRWMEGQAMPQRLEDGSIVWRGQLQDITDRKVVDDALRDKQEAESANRAKSDFLARVSLELRTPLNAILGFAQVLALDKAQPLQALQRTRVNHIEAAGRDLLGLIDEVLDVTAIETGGLQLEPVWLNVKTLTTRVTRLVENVARQRDVDIRVSAHSTISIHADPVRLGQIMGNLMSNAVKHVDNGGTITVTCAQVDKNISMTVHHSGPGMSDTRIGRLFEPFDSLGQERSAIQDAGLGLVIVKKLVQAMTGTICVDSDVDQGVTYHVTLPQRQADTVGPVLTSKPIHITRSLPSRRGARPVSSAPMTIGNPLVEPANESVHEPAREPATVLYVEDNPVNAMIMQAICEYQPGLRLHVAVNGQEAIAWQRQHKADLLLLDMNLPDIDGIALLARLREVAGHAETPAVAVSADAESDFMTRAVAAGFCDYWTKPLDVDAALSGMSKLLNLTRRATTRGAPLAA